MHGSSSGTGWKDGPLDEPELTLFAFEFPRLFDQAVRVCARLCSPSVQPQRSGGKWRERTGCLRDDAAVRKLDRRVALQPALDHLLLHLSHAFDSPEPPLVPFVFVLPRGGGQCRVEEEGGEPDMEVEGELFVFGAADRFLDAAFTDETERADRVCRIGALWSVAWLG